MSQISDSDGIFLYMPHANTHADRSSEGVHPPLHNDQKDSTLPNTTPNNTMARKGKNTGNSSSSSSKPAASAVEHGKRIKYNGNARRDKIDTRKIPPLPPCYERRDNPPISSMATYHICRLCHRPRSHRYHRENPISPGVPLPPPGICRRCRVAPSDDKVDHTRIYVVPESMPVRFGLDCIIPGSAIVTREEMEGEIRQRQKAMRRQSWSYRRESSSSEDNHRDTKTILSYRHIDPEDMLRLSKNRAIANVSEENLAALNCANDRKKDKPQNGIAKVPERETVISPTDTQDVVLRAADKSRGDHSKPTHPQYTESAIRRIARDEVERYRQAERRIDAHPQPYARGKLVPIEKQPKSDIEVEAGAKWWPTTVPPPPTELGSEAVKEYSGQQDKRRDPSHAASTKSETQEERKARLEAVYDSIGTPADARPVASNRGKQIDVHPQTEGLREPRQRGKDDNNQRLPSYHTTSKKREDDTSDRNQIKTPYSAHVNVKHTDSPKDNSDRTIKINAGADHSQDNADPRQSVRRPKHPGESEGRSYDRKTPRNAHLDNASLDYNDSSSHWTDREYWEAGEPARTASRHSSSHQYQVKRKSKTDGETTTRDAYDVTLDRTVRPEPVQNHDSHTLRTPSSERTSRKSERTDGAVVDRRQGDEYNGRHRRPPGHDVEWIYKHRSTEHADGDTDDREPSTDMPVLHEGRRSVDTSVRTSNRASRKEPNSLDHSRQTRYRFDPEIQRSSQVRFANKVDVSPTPPASEDYPPSLDKYASQRQSRRAERQRDTDIAQDQTRAARGRPREQVQHVKDPREPRVLPESHKRREEDRALADGSYKPPSDEFDAVLMRSKSESPSREMHKLRVRESRHEPAKDARPRLAKADRYGPYREERPSDSMVAIRGSLSEDPPARGSFREI